MLLHVQSCTIIQYQCISIILHVCALICELASWLYSVYQIHTQ